MLAPFTRLAFSPPPRAAHGVLLGAAAAILAVAYITQYGFGFRPCELCLLQRIPYFVLIALSLLALVALRTFTRPLLLLSALVMAASLALAIYHSGVEHHIFTGPSGCTDDITANLTLEELRKKILEAQVVSCDTPALRWFGFSMAEWNIVSSFLLLSYALRAYIVGKAHAEV